VGSGFPSNEWLFEDMTSAIRLLVELWRAWLMIKVTGIKSIQHQAARVLWSGAALVRLEHEM
jgi:hypothetical protein